MKKSTIIGLGIFVVIVAIGFIFIGEIKRQLEMW